jgi:DNA-binding beta-propeller fold protein YncE
VSPASTQAQIIALDKDVAATAIDLLLESKTLSARLTLDVRGDLDGKPDDASLLTAQVDLNLDQQAGKGARWTSVQLPAEFVFAKAQSETAPGRLRRYWLVLQSLEGTAAWSVDKAVGTLNMQSTRDGGLSWRDAIAMPNTLLDETIAPAGPFTAFFRLRTQPKTFQVPIELQAGRDKSEVRIKLDRFQPLGRVDFVLDTELAQGINESLAKAPPTTSPDTEHLHNVDFDQWSRVGDEMKSQPEINLERLQRPISAVAFAPDGTLAYVLDQGRTDFLLVIDVACNRELENKRIRLKITDPQSFVISPDGRRAYVTNGDRLQVINLTENAGLGEPFDLELVNGELRANDLALSPDGSRLYVVTFGTPPVPPLDAPLFPPPVTTPVNRIRVIDTVKLEQQLITGVTAVEDLMLVKDTGADINQTLSPKALAASPDGNLLYIVTDRGANTSEVRTVDTKTFVLLTPNITIGHTSTVPETPTALALSLDGTRLVLANVGDNNVSIIDTATGSSALVNVTKPIGVAVAPDGQRAYVLNGTDKTIRPVDLARRTLLPDFPSVEPALAATRVPVALALAPQGDQIYVANNISNTNSSVSSIQFGTRLPSEWNLTSGAVTPFCLDVAFHLVAVLGSDTMPTGLSQVVPVAESSLYEFSFWGIARETDTNEPPAVAEVLWRGGDCGPLGSPDPIPIKLIDAPPVVPPPSIRSATLFSANAAGRTARGNSGRHPSRAG